MVVVLLGVVVVVVVVVVVDGVGRRIDGCVGCRSPVKK